MNTPKLKWIDRSDIEEGLIHFEYEDDTELGGFIAETQGRIGWEVWCLRSSNQMESGESNTVEEAKQAVNDFFIRWEKE